MVPWAMLLQSHPPRWSDSISENTWKENYRYWEYYRPPLQLHQIGHYKRYWKDILGQDLSA